MQVSSVLLSGFCNISGNSAAAHTIEPEASTTACSRTAAFCSNEHASMRFQRTNQHRGQSMIHRALRSFVCLVYGTASRSPSCVNLVHSSDHCCQESNTGLTRSRYQDIEENALEWSMNEHHIFVQTGQRITGLMHAAAGETFGSIGVSFKVRPRRRWLS